MAKSSRRAQKQRSPRIVANDGPRATFITYSSKPAQLIDVSVTGARLLSRRPAVLKVGDIVNIEFTLDSVEDRIATPARVVRSEGDYDFAVRFVEMKMTTSEKLGASLKKFVSLKSSVPRDSTSRDLKEWAQKHRRGLLVAALGLVLAAIIGTAIILSSDEHQGKELRAWGNRGPKQWYWDYINHFN